MDKTEHVRLLVEGMREAADTFEDGGLTLDRLVWGLKSRISALQNLAEHEWVEELRSSWWQLEYVNAFWIESGRSELSEDERQQIAMALEELRPLLVEY